MQKVLDLYAIYFLPLVVMKKVLKLLMFTLVVLTDNGSHSLSKQKQINAKKSRKALTCIAINGYI